MKICKRCNKNKPLSNFTKNKSKKSHDARCKKCCNEWAKEYYIKNRSEITARLTKYRQKNPEGFRRRNREFRLKLRKEILNHYSNETMACGCCGVDYYEFLALDHVNENGAEERKRFPNHIEFMRFLRKRNFPKGYQVLCMNCNYAKSCYGKCPHQK